MDLNIEGNAALVTASSSGLGKASAKALAREGVDVVINGRDEARLDDAVAEIRRVATGDVVGQVGDITEPREIDGLVERAVDEFGRLDHLVTSAGGPPRLRPLEATDEDWYEAYDLLVMSVVRTVREAAPHLCANDGGTIVNVASRTVKEARPGNVLSSAVRPGVIGLEKTLSEELAPQVRANAVLPGAHETPRVLNEFELTNEQSNRERYERVYEDRDGEIPVERLGEPMELGDLVAYLSSPRSGFINGQAIVIDGGAGKSTL